MSKLGVRILCFAGAVVIAGAAMMPATGQASTKKKHSSVRIDQAGVGVLTISGTPTERPGPFDWISADPTPTLRSLIQAIDSVGEDDSLRALVIKLDDAALAATQVEELSDAISDVREAGKKVYVVGDSYNTTGLMLGAAADLAIAHHGTPVSFPGVYIEQYFLHDMFEWVGIEASYEQIGEYKGADETYTRSAPSEPWKENLSQLLDSMYDNIRSSIKDGTGLNDAQLDHAMEKAFYTSAEEAVELGLIDKAVDLGELESMLEDDLGDPIRWETDLIENTGGLAIDPSNPFAIFSMLMRDPSNHPTRPTIAVVHIDGVIMDGESKDGGLFGSSSVGSRTIRGVLDELADDDLVEGVVIRINSPGGSATASEVIWRAVRKVAEAKPVYVSVGNMAASGGYYIAVSGDKIFVDPSSIVGSIGVVGGKLALSGLFENLRIHPVGQGRGPRAELFGSSKPWNDEQRAAVREMMQETYDLFESRVAAGRDGIDLNVTARGRIFTGNKAIGLRMADEIGSLTDAIEELAKERELTKYDVLDYPGPVSLEKILEQFTGGKMQSEIPGMFASASMEPMIRAIVGDAAWSSIRERIDAAFMLRHQPIMLLDPSILIFK
ncbi:MAG TPA: S49 family peptidase [Phycisphaerales bacterium]|nr:S49 family peptidase [Phycisphaerales bacterium]